MKKKIIRNLDTGQLRTVVIDSRNYFYVQDIKSSRPDLKVDVDKIIYVGKEPLIYEGDVAQRTEFDEMIRKTFFKTKEKD